MSATAKKDSSTGTSQSQEHTVEKLQAEFSLSKAMSENSPIDILVANADLEGAYANSSSVKALKILESAIPCRKNNLFTQNIDVFHTNRIHQQKLLANPKNLAPRPAVLAIWLPASRRSKHGSTAHPRKLFPRTRLFRLMYDDDPHFLQQ